jgi:glycosyltransferase involved in cell wall biosynthesis
MIKVEIMKTIKKIIFFTNVVAPYRVSLFNLMEKIRLENHGFYDFEVYFMRISEYGRNWNIEIDRLKFKFTIGNGFYIHLGYLHLHFNPVLIFRLIQSRDEIILGSSWNDLNVLSLVVLKRLGFVKNRFSIWSEANYLTIQSKRKNFLRDKLRSFVFKSIDGSFIVPGEMALLSFEKWKINVKSVIKLPNLVSDQLFFRSDIYFVDPTRPIFLIVARLEEELKGISNFMDAIGIYNLKKIQLRIVGTGSSFDRYAQYIEKHNLKENVTLLGNLSQEQVSFEYKAANVFVLPSFSDPSPLSIVEAIFTGLPVFISNRCGNHFETVENGVNGYLFDPYRAGDIKTKFELLMSNISNWSKFSNKSIEIANANFRGEKVIETFWTSI